MLHTQIYYSHTHTVVCLHVCTLNASQLHLHLLIRKKFIFFKKCNPVPPCKQENDTMMTLMGTLYVCVCVYLLRTHTNIQIQYISVQQQLTYLNIYRDTRTHTYKYIIVAHTLTRTHSCEALTHTDIDRKVI